MGGSVGITVFTGSDFRGKSATFQRNMPVLRTVNLNDRIASLRIAPGEQWEVCQDDNYRGRCIVISGDASDLRRNAWANTISSMRRIRSAAGVIPAPIPTPSTRDWHVLLFDRSNYRGSAVNFRASVANLSPARPVTHSVTVGKGVWELCDGPNFTGRCLTLVRSTPNLGGTRQGFRVRSLRPVVRQSR